MRKEEACPCGQAEDPRARELRSWLTEHRDEPGVALPALQKAQEVYGFLPVEAQRLVAGELGKPLSEIYGIATFYSMFSLTPKGRNHISVCLGTACYVKGGGHIYELLQQKLGIEGGRLHSGRAVQPGRLPVPGLLRHGPGDHGEQRRIRKPHRGRARCDPGQVPVTGGQKNG